MESDGTVAQNRHDPGGECRRGVVNATPMAIDFAAGCIAGCASIVVGQPFDTIKVRVQTQGVQRPLPGAGSRTGAGAGAGGVRLRSGGGAAACLAGQPVKQSAPIRPGKVPVGAVHLLKQTIRNEGVSALFKGIGPPLATAAMVNAIMFSVYAESKRFLFPGAVERTPGDPWAGSWAAFWCGSLAGLCQTTVVVPTENIKVKLQVQVGRVGAADLRYRGSLDAVSKLVREQGPMALIQGGRATVLREVPSIGLYFACYEGSKQWLEERLQMGAQAASFWSGGLAGTLSWLSVYPVDVIKSVQQAAEDPGAPETRSIRACFRKLHSAGGGGLAGLRPLFRGAGTTVVRAFPVNAVIFPVYEVSASLLGGLAARRDLTSSSSGLQAK